jgi:hypothetical protein
MLTNKIPEGFDQIVLKPPRGITRAASNPRERLLSRGVLGKQMTRRVLSDS